MRFIIFVKSTADMEAEDPQAPRIPAELMAEMTAYHAELAQAGCLLDGSGLQPSRTGWRIRYDGNRRTVVDGPFAETKELVAGYTLIQVRSREEAMEWARRFPNPSADHGVAEIEVRQLFELDDFGADAAERLRAIGLS